MHVCMYVYLCTFSFSSHSLSLVSNLCLEVLSSPLSLRTSSFSRRVVLWAWSNSSLNLMLLSDICTALRGVRSEREIEGTYVRTYVPLLYPHTPAPAVCTPLTPAVSPVVCTPLTPAVSPAVCTPLTPAVPPAVCTPLTPAVPPAVCTPLSCNVTPPSPLLLFLSFGQSCLELTSKFSLPPL